MTVDYLVVGSGLTGATIARALADSGREVLVIDRRTHLGGNVHDSIHPSGVRIHTYGPHYFRTGSEKIWEFVNRFARFYRYDALVMTEVEERLEHWPITAEYIRRAVGDWAPLPCDAPRNFEDACLSMMPRPVYEKFVRQYSEKQWGVPACNLAANLAGRFEVRTNGDVRLKLQKYQGIPEPGYAAFMQNMLKGIEVRTGSAYANGQGDFQACKLLVYTGAIDEFFGYGLGRLAYRGQRRIHEYCPEARFVQPCGQVNNPDPRNGDHIRTLEWKHMMPAECAARIEGSVLTREIPFTPSDPDQFEYPFPDEANAGLYGQYRKMASALPSTLICGRLGEYRYYDMDQAIGRALTLAGKILA